MYRRLHRKPSQKDLLESHVAQLVIRHGSPELALEAIERTHTHMPDTQARLRKKLLEVIELRDQGGAA